MTVTKTMEQKGKRMSAQEAKQAAAEYRWPLLMAAVGAGLLVAGFSWEAVKDPAILGAIGSGIVSVIQYALKNSEKKTAETLDYQKLLAGLAIGERLDSLQADLAMKHKENLAQLAALSQEQSENARLHGEHIAVTDSHAAALIAIESVVKAVDDTFQLPPLHQRQPPATEAGHAERAG